MLAQGIGGETQRTRTPSIASRHSHSLEDDDDEGEATIVFTAVDLHGKKTPEVSAFLLTNPNSAFSFYPWMPFFHPAVPSPRVV
jgi:hypothetical protein